MAEINIEKMAQNVAQRAIQELRDNGVFVSRWIPVSKWLPEESKRYIVATKYNDVMTDFYTGERFLQGDDIIAWMPLPEPYKAESEEKQEQTRDEKMIDAIGFAIKATDSQDDYSMGMRNGMRYVKSLIDGKEPQYEFRRTDEEIKLGIDLGDEVIGDYGKKGVVVGIDTYKGEVLLSLLMRIHKVPQLVKASGYKTKTGRHFPQIIEVLEQMKGDTDGKDSN